ncbi:splicing factor YJU2 [Condylostylus longicornis]|uniref:splicing factor YJU2 n=1 Tax=Condylostylus longicornis TaxID=2530218 RepID=UPI00244E0078|nr:splicing factor YJU2 [Condylostylus longicornis]
MSERKVLNKYYPPDFDPSKIPRMKLAKNRQYTVRLMAPFNMRCKTCGEYIYKGKKFNARKEDVENETYLGIRIYRFYIKCTRCLQEISFKTDPKNTDYEIEAGATRNFMALKLAEEQARREDEELKEEEANNPMKLLENRTEQSKNEIELLESLEELKDLNRRHQNVDYETMLQAYDNTETLKQILERQEKEDEEMIKSVKFKRPSASSTTKIIAEEHILDENYESFEPSEKKAKLSTIAPSSTETLKSVGGFSSKNLLKNIVRKPSVVNNTEKSLPVSKEKVETEKSDNATKPKTTGLSLISAYSDSDSSSSS